MDNRVSIPQQNNFISSKHKRSETTSSFVGCPSQLHHLRRRKTRKILVGEGCHPRRNCSQPKSPQHYRSPAASPPRFSFVFIAQPVIRKQRTPMAAIDATSAKSCLLRFRSNAPLKQREPSNQVRPLSFVAPPDLPDAIKAVMKKGKSSASTLKLDSDNHHRRGQWVSVQQPPPRRPLLSRALRRTPNAVGQRLIITQLLEYNSICSCQCKTKNADEFTSRLLDIHSQMLQINKTEDIRLAIMRSDYMVDDKTKSLLQIEMNTISTSFALIGCLMTGLHKEECINGKIKAFPQNRASIGLFSVWCKCNSSGFSDKVLASPTSNNTRREGEERFPFTGTSWLAATLTDSR
ncbi:hypothetical protein LR48_Vigan02g056600 [Vigna angularis]|uniref:Uncharacterized protein n=1 Tax=Phaseolus angularis TaxID=3914 RepID=A0A0L9TV86_PHAAN|nr:hypothetical protein LR48_Vigan02g056600 [Vigna angularis]